MGRNERRAASRATTMGTQQPWIYNPKRRAILQAELDAIFAHLNDLNTEDLRCILDPEDVCGKGCITRPPVYRKTTRYASTENTAPSVSSPKHGIILVIIVDFLI